MDEQVIVGTLVAQGVLRILLLQLDAMLQLCVRSFDGCELHVAHCGLFIGCIAGHDSVEHYWHRPS